MNDVSSRSHAVFTLELQQVLHDIDTDETTEKIARLRYFGYIFDCCITDTDGGWLIWLAQKEQRPLEHLAPVSKKVQTSTNPSRLSVELLQLSLPVMRGKRLGQQRRGK
jgi:hypothetical protein